MKIVFICLLFSAYAFSKEVVDTYSNGTNNNESIQAEEEFQEENRPIKNAQERMEERRGWQGSSIEPSPSPKFRTDDEYRPNRNIEGRSE